MLKVITQNLQSNTKLFNGLTYHFNKKVEPKKKKSQAPKVAAKTMADYMQGPQQLKKNTIQVKNMQTSSQATLEENSLKQIIIEQRTLLQKSLWEQIKPPKGNQYSSFRSKIINKYLKQEQLNKYYIKRPLRYLQNIYFALFLGNIGGLAWFEYLNSYHQIGWFYGYFTTPAATSTLALLLGYNFAFWVVRHSFHTHINIQSVPKSKISLISTSWRNFIELTFIASQFMGLAYCLSFGYPFSPYKLQLILATVNFAHLAVNISQIIKHARISFRSYLREYLKIVSLTTMLIMIFALYHIQVTSGAQPQNIFQNQSYRQRAIEIHEGYADYLSYFKKKKYIMKQDQKINPNDED